MDHFFESKIAPRHFKREAARRRAERTDVVEGVSSGTDGCGESAPDMEKTVPCV